MKVSECMTTPVITVSPTTSVADLMRVLEEKAISGVPVVDADKRLAGIVSRQDVLLLELRLLEAQPSSGAGLDQILNGGFVTVAEERLKSRSTPVRDIMTAAEQVLSCSKDTLLQEACELMVGNRIHRLPVLSGRKLVGILTTLDVVRAVAQRRL